MQSGIGNLLLGALGMLLIGAFLVGLAVSIGSIPFAIIVAGVLILAVCEYYEDAVQPLFKRSGGAGSRDAG
jgi:hypothetical protein